MSEPFQTMTTHVFYFKSEADLTAFIKSNPPSKDYRNCTQYITGPHRVLNKKNQVVYPEQFYWTLTRSFTSGALLSEAYEYDESSPTFVPNEHKTTILNTVSYASSPYSGGSIKTVADACHVHNFS